MRIHLKSALRTVLAAVLSGAFALASRDAHALDQSPEAPSFGGEAGAGPDTIAGEIAVDLLDSVTPADVADVAARQGISMRPNSAWSEAHDKLEVADVDPAREDAILEALSHDGRVEHAEPMAIYRASFVPNDPFYA